MRTHLLSVLDPTEHPSSSEVLVAVRMVLQSEFTVSLPDLRVRRLLGDSENFVQAKPSLGGPAGLLVDRALGIAEDQGSTVAFSSCGHE